MLNLLVEYFLCIVYLCTYLVCMNIEFSANSWNIEFFQYINLIVDLRSLLLIVISASFSYFNVSLNYIIS